MNIKHLLPAFFGALFFSVLVPTLAFADVKINEVAWMGTASSQYSEWLELYNSGSDAISLAGWKLYTGTDVMYTLSKTIAANGYLLVERVTASAPDAVPGINDESGSFAAGGLSNAGENLTLKDATGAVMDSLPYASGWPAGDSTTKDTMQWNGSQWITAPGTPDAPNATEGDIDTTITSGKNPPTSSSSSSSSSSTTSTTTTTKKPTVPKASTAKPKITITAPKSIFQGARNEFDATAALSDILKASPGYYYWNMGDGTTYVQSTLAPIAYTYHYAGTYTVSLSYFPSWISSQPVAQDTASVVVTVPLATLAVLNNGAALEITNSGTKAMDIGQWPITTALGVRAMPPLTVIAAKAHIIIPASSLGLSSIQHPVLSTPDGIIVQSKAKK
jgi:hypothetical protein